jgi:hypothetical protein
MQPKRSHFSTPTPTHLLIVLLCVLLQWAAPAQPPARELLNSERIAERFGGYGIEVLESDAALRVSNLFSTDGNPRVCRTFAVVRYPDAVDPAFAAEHAVILKGGSIGAVFAAAGWEVRKSHLYFGERPAAARVATLMSVPTGTLLAEHVYVLDIAKNGQIFQYAALVEIHHPEYLRRADLPRIYGSANSAGHDALVEALLTTAARSER